MSYIYRCEICWQDYCQDDPAGLEDFAVSCDSCAELGCEDCVYDGLCEQCRDADLDDTDEPP